MTHISYNGYTFPTYSHVTVDSGMQYDDAERTVLYHRYTVRVQMTIVAEGSDTYVGQNYQRIRQLLSKSGGPFIINHRGFGPELTVNYNTGGPKDVAFGPKPRVLRWNPVGDTNAVEVDWECEICLPACEGLGGVRFSGLSTLNYAVSYRINMMGYTTRTVSGYLEIAMTRDGRNIPDTADAYRDFVVIDKPYNFQRETTWSLSQDKRRAEFTITDSEIESPNAYPAGVIRIRANHRVGWTRRALATLPNTVSASITLAPGQPRGRAWAIFRAIVAQRIAFAAAPAFVFFESMEVSEEIYDNTVSFSLSYRLYFGEGSALSEIFTATGLFSVPAGDWVTWAQSVAPLQSHRGRAQLTHNATEDQILDLCTDTVLPSTPNPYFPPTNPPSPMRRFCNARPDPKVSYIRFEGAVSTIEDTPSTVQITLGADDLRINPFDPADPTDANGQTDAAKNIKRIIESAASNMEFEWVGYAERVGYDIPRPGKITLGGVTLVRRGKGVFRKKFLGMHFCQPVYGAAWRFRYVVDTRPSNVPASDADPVNGPSDTTTGEGGGPGGFF